MKFQYNLRHSKHLEWEPCIKCDGLFPQAIPFNNDYIFIYAYDTIIGTVCYGCVEILEETDPDFAVGLGAINEV